MILTAYLGLAVTFLILITLLLMLLIKVKGRIITKFVIIPVVIWYSLVLLYLPNSFMGWPTGDEIPDNSIILTIFFNEPRGSSKGAIYLLVLTKNIDTSKRSLFEQLDYRGVFKYNYINTPRIYRIPYNRGVHKALFEKLMLAKKSGKDLIKKGKINFDDLASLEDMGAFKVMNQVELDPRLQKKYGENEEQE